MAIKNAIMQGSYSTVDVDYAKKTKRISIKATVFTDVSCSAVLTTLLLNYQGIKEAVECDRIMLSEDDVPNNPAVGDIYFTPNIIDFTFQTVDVPVLDADGKPQYEVVKHAVVDADNKIISPEERKYLTEKEEKKTKVMGILTYNGSGWNTNPVEVVYCSGKYYKYTVSGYQEYSGEDTIKWWDENFAVEKTQDFADIYEFAYTWLTTNHPVFINKEKC